VRYEIGIVGSGGQGVILMGIILAKAITASQELFIAQAQSFDPAVRGGRAESYLVMSDEEIDYPSISGFDLLLALSQEGCNRNIKNLKKEALLVIDSELVKEATWGKILKIPFTKIARESFNDERVANMIALGVLTEFCEYIPSSAVKASIGSEFKAETLNLNLSAFQKGVEMAEVQKLDFERAEEEDREV